MTTEEFITRAKQVHGDKYDYSLVKYVNANTKIKIICKIHGIFEQRPLNHLYNSHGCPKCGGNKRLTKDEFEIKANEVHGNKYNYEYVEYINGQTKVKIECPTHGIFEQTPGSHLGGCGCPKCQKVEAANKQRLTKDEFEIKANEVHGNKYNYEYVEYINSRTKVKIECPTHGIFEQKPSSHLMGHGCPKCGNIVKMTADEFLKKGIQIHSSANYIYDYVDYVDYHTKVKIECPTHGIFEIRPNNFLRGQGCHKCALERNANRRKLTKEEFETRANVVHDNKYDYSETQLNGVDKNARIRCPYHGYFWQRPYSHLCGCGCPKCSGTGIRNSHKFNLLEEFESEYAFRTFLENNDINILLLIITNIEPKYKPLKKDIMFALRHADEINPIQYLREKYSSESNDSFAQNTNNTDITSSDSNDDIVNDILSQKIKPNINDNLSIGDIIKNDSEEIQVINRLDCEHLITPEIREYIMNKFINDMHRNKISSSK